MLKYFTTLSGSPETVRIKRMIPIAKIAAMNAFIDALCSSGVIASRCLFSIDREPEQHIARCSARRDITGVDVEHPSSDHRSRSVNRSAAGGYAVHRLVRLLGIEVPDNFPVGCGISPQVSIDCGGKHRARNGAYGCGLCRAASRAFATLCGRRIPHLFAVGCPQRVHSSAALRIGVSGCTECQHDSADIGVCNVDVRPVGGGAPLHATHRSALADSRLPEDFSPLIRIECMN